MWIDPNTQHVYKTHAQVKAAFPQVSFPKEMTDSHVLSTGLLPVSLSTPPVFDALLQKAVELTPVETAGEWVQQWQIVATTSEEQEVIKESKRRLIQQAAESDRNAGFASSALGAAHHYGSTLEDRINLIGASQAGQPSYYNCKENGQRARKIHTPAQINQVLQDGFVELQTINTKENDLLDAIDQALTADDLDLVVW